ncbi:MAG TPA: glycoside hydrolase family 15 protein [Methylomirabilota bacterium]|jgi:GH15 family glucan-1,4-alpha-glucosidase|nr:glycoside hydrolase family 15 protein [Methylomirabilota bacterium]
MPDRYVPLRDYALIGDGRTAALISRHGSIDWWCLPDLGSPSVFAAILDADRGGRWVLRPEDEAEAHRRYVPDTNLLETTYTTATGRVRVIDAMTLPGRRLAPLRELARRVEGVDGRVAMRWRIEPRFGYGLGRTRIEARAPFPVATSGSTAIAVCAWDAGRIEVDDGGIAGRFEARAGTGALIAVVAAHGEPLVFPARDDVEARIETTAAFWRDWSAHLAYTGPWRDAVVRSALALKLLVFAPSGAIAAAPTTSLPEVIGGERNWDYRFSWIRDSAFTLESLLQLGCESEAQSFFWWFMHATRRTLPRLNVLYRLDGGTHTPERTLPLAGYRDSRPVRIGNGAAGQLQLDTYGELLDVAYQYVQRGYKLGRDTARDIAGVADFVCSHWREPDSGIWEVRAEPRHHTQSKAMCWVALDRAGRLADAGHVSGARATRWATEAAAIRRFIDERCWSPAKRSYVWYAGGDGLDASLLLLAIMRYDAPDAARVRTTIEAIRRELAAGPLLLRYTGDDGLAGGEGAFACCSFWLAEALAICGRRRDAERLMDDVIGLANDVGLYAEEIEPTSGVFLGNFPQGLVHLALISAAIAIHGESR